MTRFNISRQLALLLGAFGVMTVVSVTVFILVLHQSSTISSRATLTALAEQARSYALLKQLADTHGEVQHFLRLKDPDEMEKGLKELSEHQKTLSENFSSAGADSASLKAGYEALTKQEQAAIEEALKGNLADAYQVFFGAAGKQYEALLAELTRHNEAIAKSTNDLLTFHRSQARRSLIWQSGLLALIMGCLISVGWRLKGRIVRELQHVCTIMAASSAQLVSAVAQVSATSQSLAQGASEQAAALEETSASLEEMSSMVKLNADNARKANELAQQARTAADVGAANMQSMGDAMREIKAASDEIAKIIRTIDEIALQTNILSLNAAVEAARAGESGMGFAVVADEVRNLAQRSANAAKETAAKIEGAISKTTYGVEINDKVAQALKDILAKTRQVNELVAEVAAASQEQTQGILQANTSVSQMEKVTQSNAASAEEGASAAEELNAQAKALKDLGNELLSLVGGRVQATGDEARISVQTPGEPAPDDFSGRKAPPMAFNTDRNQTSPGAKKQFAMR